MFSMYVIPPKPRFPMDLLQRLLALNIIQLFACRAARVVFRSAPQLPCMGHTIPVGVEILVLMQNPLRLATTHDKPLARLLQIAVSESYVERGVVRTTHMRFTVGVGAVHGRIVEQLQPLKFPLEHFQELAAVVMMQRGVKVLARCCRPDSLRPTSVQP